MLGFVWKSQMPGIAPLDIRDLIQHWLRASGAAGADSDEQQLQQRDSEQRRAGCSGQPGDQEEERAGEAEQTRHRGRGASRHDQEETLLGGLSHFLQTYSGVTERMGIEITLE